MSKHRWSREDVSYASPLLLRERLLHLQNMVEELSQRLNSISKGKSDVVTKPMAKVTPGGPSGKRKPPQQKQCSPPSIRKTVSLPCGMSGEVVPNVTPVPSVRDKKNKQRKVAGVGQPKPSIVTDASTIQPQSPAITPVAEASTNTDAPAVEKKRNLPPVKGASFAATLKSGPVAENTDPIFQPNVKIIDTSRPHQSVVRATRKRPYDVSDVELADYLHYKFLHVERTNKTPLKMKNEADAYLRKFDLSGMTWREITVLISKAIQIAMVPLDESVLLRNFLKDDKKLHEMQKHTDFVNKGELGKVGFFGKKKSLPKST